MNGGYSPEMVNRGLRGSAVDIEMVGGMAPSSPRCFTLHRVSRLSCLVVEQTLVQEAGAVN